MDVLVDRVAPGAMILGSAQWGQEYGIANTSGPPARSELGRIVDAASRAGVTSIDTARDYGRSEALIGEVVGGASGWWVMTKLSGDLVTEDADPRVVTERAEASLRASLRALRRPRIDVLLLHRAWHRDWGGGVLWDLLEDHRRRGTVAGIGVSVTSPDDVGSLVGEGSSRSRRACSINGWPGWTSPRPPGRDRRPWCPGASSSRALHSSHRTGCRGTSVRSDRSSDRSTTGAPATA